MATLCFTDTVSVSSSCFEMYVPAPHLPCSEGLSPVHMAFCVEIPLELPVIKSMALTDWWSCKLLQCLALISMLTHGCVINMSYIYYSLSYYYSLFIAVLEMSGFKHHTLDDCGIGICARNTLKGTTVTHPTLGKGKSSSTVASEGIC